MRGGRRSRCIPFTKSLLTVGIHDVRSSKAGFFVASALAVSPKRGLGWREPGTNISVNIVRDIGGATRVDVAEDVRAAVHAFLNGRTAPDGSSDEVRCTF
jgi:hypothetical protein